MLIWVFIFPLAPQLYFSIFFLSGHSKLIHLIGRAYHNKSNIYRKYFFIQLVLDIFVCMCVFSDMETRPNKNAISIALLDVISITFELHIQCFFFNRFYIPWTLLFHSAPFRFIHLHFGYCNSNTNIPNCESTKSHWNTNTESNQLKPSVNCRMHDSIQTSFLQRFSCVPLLFYHFCWLYVLCAVLSSTSMVFIYFVE